MNRMVWRRGALQLFLLLLTLPSAARAEDRLPPQIVHEPCSSYEAGHQIEIWARFLDDSKLFDPKIVYRSRASSHWKTAPFVRQEANDAFRAVIRGADARGVVEYFIEAFDENGNGPARYGAPEAPVQLRPSKQPVACQQLVDLEPPVTTTAASTEASSSPAATEQIQAAGVSTTPAAPSPLTAAPPPEAPGTCAQANRPIYCSAWFWGGVGAVVAAGAGVGVWLATSGSSPSAPPSAVTLDVTAPDPTGAVPTVGGLP